MAATMPVLDGLGDGVHARRSRPRPPSPPAGRAVRRRCPRRCQASSTSSATSVSSPSHSRWPSADQPAGGGLHGEGAAEARAEQVVEVAVGVTDRAVVAQAQRPRRAALVHRRARRRRSPASARRTVISLPSGSVEHVLAARAPRGPSAGVQLHQRAGPGELGGRERQMRALDGDHAARTGRAAASRSPPAPPPPGTCRRPAARDRRGGQRADRAPAQQLPQRQGQFGRVQRRTGGQAQHPGRGVDQVVGVGPLDPGVARRPPSATARVRSAGPARRARAAGTRPPCPRPAGGSAGSGCRPAPGQRRAQRGQAARLVPHRRPHPPQGGLPARPASGLPSGEPVRRGARSPGPRRRSVTVAA